MIVNGLAKLPLASLLTISVYLAALYSIVTGKIALDSPTDFLEFFGGIGAVTAGHAALGKVRNDAGAGVVTPEDQQPVNW